MKFVKDILTEDVEDNKYSSKKTVGVIAAIISFVLAVMDGFHFYEVSENTLDSMLLFSASMLGISVVRKLNMGSKSSNDQ